MAAMHTLGVRRNARSHYRIDWKLGFSIVISTATSPFWNLCVFGPSIVVVVSSFTLVLPGLLISLAEMHLASEHTLDINVSASMIRTLTSAVSMLGGVQQSNSIGGPESGVSEPERAGWKRRFAPYIVKNACGDDVSVQVCGDVEGIGDDSRACDTEIARSKMDGTVRVQNGHSGNLRLPPVRRRRKTARSFASEGSEGEVAPRRGCIQLECDLGGVSVDPVFVVLNAVSNVVLPVR